MLLKLEAIGSNCRNMGGNISWHSRGEWILCCTQVSVFCSHLQISCSLHIFSRRHEDASRKLNAFVAKMLHPNYVSLKNNARYMIRWCVKHAATRLSLERRTTRHDLRDGPEFVSFCSIFFVNTLGIAPYGFQMTVHQCTKRQVPWRPGWNSLEWILHINPIENLW